MSARDNGGPAPRRRGVRAWIAHYLADRRGAVSPILVLALVPIIGALGMGVEGSNWWLTQRALQNAADTAAMAANWNGGTNAAGSASGSGFALTYSTNGCSSHPDRYDCEAVGAAASAGFTNGVGNVVVYPQYLPPPNSGCPGALSASACYKVTIIKKVPLYLLGVVGFLGDTTITSGRAQAVEAVAYAAIGTQSTADCIFSLSTTATGLTTNGAPKANLAGCDIALSSSGKCDGGNLNAPESFFPSGSSDKNCGLVQTVAAPPADPYAALNAKIPADTCAGSYPQGPTANQISGKQTWGTTKVFCGDVNLTGNVTVESNTTIVIYNGGFNFGANTFQTDAGAGAALVFAGSNTFTSPTGTITPSHVLSGSGTIDIAAQTSGDWSGIAIYQAPNLTSNVSISVSGNSPTLDITGVFYQPQANDTFSGAIDKSSNGASCFVWVFNQMTVNGTALIYNAPSDGGVQSQCGRAGVAQLFTLTNTHALVG